MVNILEMAILIEQSSEIWDSDVLIAAKVIWYTCNFSENMVFKMLLLLQDMTFFQPSFLQVFPVTVHTKVTSWNFEI